MTPFSYTTLPLVGNNPPCATFLFLSAAQATFHADGKPTAVHADRYEFWIYRQIRKRLKSGEIYLNDSLQHRRLTDELVSLEEKAEVLDQLDILWLRQPIDIQLKALSDELRAQWLALERELRQGKLKHFDYDSKTGAHPAEPDPARDL